MFNNNETVERDTIVNNEEKINKNNYDKKNIFSQKKNKKEDNVMQGLSLEEKNDATAKSKESDKTKKKQRYKEKRNNDRYVGSSPYDLIRDLYNTAKISPETTMLDSDFIKYLEDYKVDEKYNKAIQDAIKNKKKADKIKDYKFNWSQMLAIPIMRLLENTDKDGKISIGDYNDFINGPFRDLKNRLLDDLNAKDSDGKPTAIVEMQVFIKKAIEELNNIENNNNFAFNPTQMRYDLGDVYKNTVNIYKNISFLQKIIIAIYNFFTFSNFYKDIPEMADLSNKIIEDVNSYYNLPLEERQLLVNRIIQKIARIKYLSSRNFFIPSSVKDCIKKIEDSLDVAVETKIDSVDAIVSFIKSFGADAVKNVCINSINEDLNKCLMDKISKEVSKTYKNVGELEAGAVATSVLNYDEDTKYKPISVDRNIFYEGKLKDEYNKMVGKIDEISSLEDIKIKCNNNLIKVDAIKKQTKKIIEGINMYFSSYSKRLFEMKKNYSLLASSGANYSVEYINSNIKNLQMNFINNVDNVLNNFKNSFYEYEDNEKERKKVINSTDKKFAEEKEYITKIMKEYLYKDGQPKIGKENNILEIKDMLSDMKNPAKLSFESWETINKMAEQLKKQVEDENNLLKSTSVAQPNNNLFDLAKDKMAIENKVLNDVISKGHRFFSRGGNQRDIE